MRSLGHAATIAAFVALSVSAGCRRKAHAIDDSRHIQFITVEEGVRLEVVDWGGSGRPLVLLAGSGNTAHVFDEFAPKLTAHNHVYGITRRGYGPSSHPQTGYEAQRLAKDIVSVLDTLGLAQPVLAGHSLGGYELGVLAALYPYRAAGIVLLDATIIDPTVEYPQFLELVKRLPVSMQAAMQGRGSITFPESELGAARIVSSSISPADVRDAIHSGMLKLDYTKIRVPVLAFYSLPMPLDDQVRQFQPATAEERAAMEQVDLALIGISRAASGALRAAVPTARIVEIPGANHYLFLSNEAQVLTELRAFLARLH